MSSGRGRGNVSRGNRGGARGQQSSRPGGGGGRGGGGRDGGRGRGSSAYYTPTVESDFPSLSAPAHVSPPSISAPSLEVEKKLNLQSSASSSASTSASTSASPQAKDNPPVQPETKQLIQTEPPPASSKAVRFPRRPGFGTIGRKCTVRANHFLVEVADKNIHHYDVSITPEVKSKEVCRSIMLQLVSSYHQSHLGEKMLAYDGRKNVYAAGSLPFSSKEFVIKLSDDGARKEREFKVSIKFAGKADLYQLQQFLRGQQVDASQDTIQALDVVLRATPSRDFEVVGRSFYSPKLGTTGELGDGILYWTGFYQSLRLTQMGLSLNIDISARGFYEPILVTEFIGKYLNIRDLTRPLSEQIRVKVKKALRGVKVEMKHGGYVKRSKISGLSTQPLNQLTFSLDGTGTNTSVIQYFRQKYNIVLRNTSLPAIQCGSDTKPVYLPMEICTIVAGQRYTRRLNEKQVRALLKATCQRPKIREDNIKQMVKENKYSEQEVNKGFGIQVRPELVSIGARVLPPPMLKYHGTGKESTVNPWIGAWNMIDKKMVNAGEVDYWTCISFSSRLGHDAAINFCQALVKMCRNRGMRFNEPFLPIQTAHPSQIERNLVNVYNQSMARFKQMGLSGKQLQLLIVILPDASGSYGTIKRVCETELGIVSQCCKPDKVSRINEQYLENVSLKINVKVGGRNTVLEQAVQKRIPYLTDVPTIVFGADVTHPQAGEDSGPSIAAVVASMDWPEVTKYRGLVSAQQHRQEIIQDLYKTTVDPQKGLIHGGMIRELLLAFYKSTNQKPHRIIFYRDGVGEGQFSQVLWHEMDAIRKACASLQENYMPRVTFIVVQKRHHTRLFPVNHGDRNSTDKSGNILPGTVVDTMICHPMEFDFFLCSHAGIQGTSRPAHYHVLYDENGFNADALQSLTNNLCYTYARCTRSVSIVPPAYYAHLAAFRARYYIEGESDSGSTSTGRASRGRNVDPITLPAIKDNVKEVMFYC